MRKPGLRRSRGRSDGRTADQVSCPICGLRNEGRPRFCRNCGLPMGTGGDPVRGTKSRRPELPGDRGAGIGAIIGLLVALAVLGVSGYLIVRTSGDISSRPTLPPTAAPSAAPAEPSVAPEATTSPGGGDLATEEPVAPPPESTGDTGFTCKPAGFDDPTGGTWKVTKVRADAGDRMDTLTITLTRQDGPGNTRLDVQRMAARDVELTTGLGAPAAAKAIVISFGGDVVADEAFTGTPALKAIDSFDVESLGDGVFAVVGVNRDGCFRLSAPTWAEGADAAPGDTITLLLDVRYK